MWWLEAVILSLFASTIYGTAISNIQKEESIKTPVFDYFKDLPNNVTDIANHINDGLKSLNISDIEVNIFLNHMDGNMSKLNNNNTDLWEFEKSIKYLFKNTVISNWHMKDILKDIATTVDSITVHEILYEILWEQLKSNDMKNNPFSYIELYKDVEKILTDNISSIRLRTLLSDIEKDLVKSSANVLHSYFIHNSTVYRLLTELKKFKSLYHITIPIVFDKLNTIENQWLISNDLLDFDTMTAAAVYNHISYMKYLNSSNKTIPDKIYANLEILIARIDFTNISAEERAKSSKLLPLSMANLFTVEKICLKNITSSFYLYECPETFLMCSNPIQNNKNPLNRKKAAYEIKRVGGNAYTLHSSFWSRYLRLQSNNSKQILAPRPSNITNVSKITKNLYSNAESSSWLISFRGDYATLQDSKEKSYICGGDSSTGVISKTMRIQGKKPIFSIMKTNAYGYWKTVVMWINIAYFCTCGIF
ncbi:hypothetical protein DOY81_011843 [Sarcophaga bullata]|nr:hypothetical protein DOY81_011843 [Sarcophaga bullata]